MREFDLSLTSACARGSVLLAFEFSRVFNMLPTRPVNISRASRYFKHARAKNRAFASVAGQSVDVYFSPASGIAAPSE